MNKPEESRRDFVKKAMYVAPVIATLERETSHVDRDPSPQNRARLSQAREAEKEKRDE